jgi:ketosteroid isomerase-like protein
MTEAVPLTRQAAIALVERYFRCVDDKDMAGVLDCLTGDCHFRIESDQLDHLGRDSGVRTMFERLFARYERIWHGNFRWVFDEREQILACQLDVINMEPSGAEHRKYNASFYHLREGRIAYAGIYMSGVNVLV